MSSGSSAERPAEDPKARMGGESTNTPSCSKLHLCSYQHHPSDLLLLDPPLLGEGQSLITDLSRAPGALWLHLIGERNSTRAESEAGPEPAEDTLLTPMQSSPLDVLHDPEPKIQWDIG